MIESVENFINSVLRDKHDTERFISYRGHANSDFKLIPSVMRTEERQKTEHILLRELIAAHPDDFERDKSALQALVRVQHFSLPTRLLDVTFNPLVALYFACEPTRHTRSTQYGSVKSQISTPADGEVITISSCQSSVKYFDSDAVSCLANMAYLSYELKSRIDTSLSKEEFNCTLPIKRLIHFVKQEKFGFDPEIQPSHLWDVYLVKPKQNNKRIIAQSGAFLIFGCSSVLTNSPIHQISRIAIPADYKEGIRSELETLGIHEKSLFPDIERTAHHLVSASDKTFGL